LTLQPRDKRALMLLSAAIVLSAIIYFWPQGGGTTVVAPAVNSIPLAEQRLARLRQTVATIPGKEQLLAGVVAQLKEREKGLIEAETAAQAQAQLLQIVRRLLRAQSPPLELGQVDMGAVQLLGDDYAEALVSVSLSCRIEQVVNLLADISAQPEAIATHELQVRAGDARQKTVNVRLTVSGVLPRRLAPQRPEGSVF
jgi:type II secretory pathway component PulM